MPQPFQISALGVPERDGLDDDLKTVFARAEEKLGFVPNVLQAYSLRPQRLRNFMALYNEVMLSASGLSRLEREMIAVVVSSANRCYYCLVAHGAAVRTLSGDAQLGEMLAMNHRIAPLDLRKRAMLDYADKLTRTPHLMGEADRRGLADAGFGPEDIFDIAETVGLYNMTNRMAAATDMMPNAEYHRMDR